MALLGVVPPDPGHAPHSSASRLSHSARWSIGVFAVVALSVGVAGPFVSAHWSFVVLALLGFVAALLLLPHDLPVLWFKSKP